MPPRAIRSEKLRVSADATTTIAIGRVDSCAIAIALVVAFCSIVDRTGSFRTVAAKPSFVAVTPAISNEF